MSDNLIDYLFGKTSIKEEIDKKRLMWKNFLDHTETENKREVWKNLLSRSEEEVTLLTCFDLLYPSLFLKSREGYEYWDCVETRLMNSLDLS